MVLYIVLLLRQVGEVSTWYKTLPGFLFFDNDIAVGTNYLFITKWTKNHYTYPNK